jgi:hypothetical protein
VNVSHNFSFQIHKKVIPTSLVKLKIHDNAQYAIQQKSTSVGIFL